MLGEVSLLHRISYYINYSYCELFFDVVYMYNIIHFEMQVLFLETQILYLKKYNLVFSATPPNMIRSTRPPK